MHPEPAQAAESDVPVLVPDVAAWLPRRSSSVEQWPAERLLAVKDGRTVSVVLPARDEEATVGTIVAAIRRTLMERAPLVDELVVVDSRSQDATAAVAAAAGATVVDQDDVPPQLPPLDGKGAALWKGLAESTGQLVAFVDADLTAFTPDFVTGLLGPLLVDPTVGYVKGFYHRPLVQPAGTLSDGGGRVTELVARPLLNLYWPSLAGFVQPLAGEYAGRREVLERIPFVSGYGVELAMLVDVLELLGLDAMAQVDLGHRQHRHHDNEVLGRMSGQVLLTAFSRLQRYGRVVAAGAPGTLLTQFRRGPRSGIGVDREVVVTDLTIGERPPLAELRAGLGAGTLGAGTLVTETSP